MDRRVNIPVRIVRPAEYQAARESADLQSVDLKSEDNNAQQTNHHEWDGRSLVEPRLEPEEARAMGVGDSDERAERPGPEVPDELEEWRDRALRLQAEMDNYRKRQRRLAQEEIQAERQRLLGSFLSIVDDLERALAAPGAGDGLRRGVELTHQAAMRLLQTEGVEPIQAENQAFDPNWHEAVATVSGNGSDIATPTVIEVIEPGYRLGGRLLRPAKVIVAV